MCYNAPSECGRRYSTSFTADRVAEHRILVSVDPRYRMRLQSALDHVEKIRNRCGVIVHDPMEKLIRKLAARRAAARRPKRLRQTP